MRFIILALLPLIIVAACGPKATSTESATAETAVQDGGNGPRKGLVFNVADTTWTEKVQKSEAEWKKILTPDQFEITRHQGTERPFSSPLEANEEEGYYFCISCANPLYSSATKFHSGTGWPSFWKPLATNSVAVAVDNSHGMVRDEVTCARCDAHLGHVFNDGPKPTGLRYCMDGFAMHFVKAKL
jgi:methionine-R-sulfoxide reductase